MSNHVAMCDALAKQFGEWTDQIQHHNRCERVLDILEADARRIQLQIQQTNIERAKAHKALEDSGCDTMPIWWDKYGPREQFLNAVEV